ncbi:MAG: hypothetical protein EOP53_09530 [Sphingobacteriales bacterium]|nr:MAG: hypothetical protein EOP53_09530 [Sphingobacteriales bacterium]
MKRLDEASEMKLFGGQLPFGAFAELAYNYNFSEKFYGILQMRISALSYKPLKGEMTKYFINGVDKLDSLPANFRYEEYDENWRTYNSDPNKPSKYHINSYNYSNVSLQVGIGYRFIKDDEKVLKTKSKKKKRK